VASKKHQKNYWKDTKGVEEKKKQTKEGQKEKVKLQRSAMKITLSTVNQKGRGGRKIVN